MTSNAPQREFAAERQARLRRQERELRKIHAAGEDPGAADLDTSGVSNAELLQAIDALRQEVAELRGIDTAVAAQAGGTEDETLDVKIEIAQMVRAIARAKSEIAAIKHPQAEEDQLTTVAKQLDAVVDATESATHTILESNEKIEEAIHKIGQTHHDDEEVQVMVENVANALVMIYEACNFQDITGQRVSKVVKTLRFIEDRILAMIGIWGAEAFIDLPVAQPVEEEPAENDPDNLMNGPQLGSEGITQADIDALFD